MTIIKGEKSGLTFVMCIRNDGADDLELRKVYQMLPDPAAVREDYVRVIDESGEDYLYPGEYFVRLKLSEAVARELASLSSRASQPEAGTRHRSVRPRSRAVRG